MVISVGEKSDQKQLHSILCQVSNSELLWAGKKIIKPTLSESYLSWFLHRKLLFKMASLFWYYFLLHRLKKGLLKVFKTKILNIFYFFSLFFHSKMYKESNVHNTIFNYYTGGWTPHPERVSMDLSYLWPLSRVVRLC